MAEKSKQRSQAAGKLRDGTVILNPTTKPEHFTKSEIRSSIKEVWSRREATTGRFTKG
jgi:hypothetical protein